MSTVLDTLTRERRKELLQVGTEFYKSGAEPNPTDVDPSRLTRADLRRDKRALGHRGAKSAKANPERMARQMEAAAKKVAQVVLIDDVLLKAKDRVEHPIASRFRR